MRILWVDNMQIRQYGNLKMGPGRKLAAGAIRNNWRLAEFSDRDVTRYLAPLGIRSIGARMANRKLVKTALNFKPDLLFIGHCDYIRNWALEEIRRALPAIRMAHINVDGLWIDWHVQQVTERLHSTDAIFVTSGGDGLKKFCTGKNVVSFMPNPTDEAFEVHDNSRKGTFRHDLLFCGREAKGDKRVDQVRELAGLLKGKLNFGLYGMMGNPPIWGSAYEEVLGESKMALNLNRVSFWPLYSSDRIAHLMGNGILTFQDAQSGLQKFFTDREMVFYEDVEDLAEKILYYQNHDEERRTVASAGREKYHRLFNSARTLKFMVETLSGLPYSEPYEWADEVYR